MTLKTTLIPFDLGKLVLNHDSSQDLELQAGDVVSIFSDADIRIPIAQQTKLVTLSGEFVHAGVYSVQPGETFRHLVERAGGFTPNAYLYGSEYTRVSTRIMQQARIDEYVQNLSMEIQRSNMAVAASAAWYPECLASTAAGQANEQNLLTSLRQIRATGRIVLDFKPDSSGTGSLPDIAMQDGDNFIVPSVPATVDVVGAVYDQNSFLFSPHGKVGEYLDMAGGPSRDADRKHEFLIHADGKVVELCFGQGTVERQLQQPARVSRRFDHRAGEDVQAGRIVRTHSIHPAVLSIRAWRPCPQGTSIAGLLLESDDF